MPVTLELREWNAEALLARVPVILEAYSGVIGPELETSIRSVRYFWPGETKRKAGGGGGLYMSPPSVGSPRDIVDRGTLMRSQTARLSEDGRSLSVVWDPVNPDNGVHYGYAVLTGEPDNLGPGRDWISPVLRQQPFLPFFVQQWRALNGGR